MSTVSITINGQTVSARPGQTVLEAARAAGIDIPTLCHHPALAPIGACRVCLVEISGQRTLQPACTFPVAERMQIQTESPKVVRARKFLLELLFSERNHFCMTCEMSGGCELQDLGYRYGLDHWMYPTYTERFPVDASARHHLLDHNRCVLCRRCIRACSDLAANHTLDLRQRGAATMVTADMDAALGESTCVGCGTCVDVCPTGALTDKRSAFMARPKEVTRVATICTQCSLGCGLNVVLHRGQVLRLESRWEAAGGGVLCRRGRFEALDENRTRVVEPLLRERGAVVPIGWEQAIATAAGRLGRTNPERLGCLTTTRLTTEGLGLLHRIFIQYLHAPQVSIGNGVAAQTFPLKNGKLADIPASDLVLLAAADPVKAQPVLSFFIRRALDKGGRLIVAENRPTDLTAFADRCFTLKEIDQAAAMTRDAQRPVVIYGSSLRKSEASALAQGAPEARFIALQPGVNTAAAATLGLNGRCEPAACDTLFVVTGEENGTWNAVAKKAGRQAFVILQTCYESPLSERADLILPMATWVERSGTFIGTDGTRLRAHAALAPSGHSRSDWDILGRLAEKMSIRA
jgi:formate dehydrogenase major subunit